MYIIENNLEVVEYENLLLPISIKIRELIQYKNKRALCHWHDDIEIIKNFIRFNEFLYKWRNFSFNKR